MKRKIALILAVVMLASAFSVITALAEVENETVTEPTASYKSVDIAYANVSYVGKIEMMFAVPVYADLPEGAEVKLVLWENYEPAYVFSYNEAVPSNSAPLAIAIDANEEKATIAGEEHLVFTYSGLSAEMMTDVVYVRPVVLLADGSRVYGDVMSYSILEYVKAAKGEIDGIAGLGNADALAALDSMLSFGALAQKYVTNGDDEAYMPCGFLANDELNKIWITPVIDGVAGERVLAGFYKAGADFASVFPLVEDLYTLEAILDSEGNEISDKDSDISGIQINAPEEGDLEITMVFEIKTVFNTTIEKSELGRYEVDHVNSTIFTQNANGKRYEISTAGISSNSGYGPNQEKDGNPVLNYSGVSVISDPINSDSGEKVLLWTHPQNSALYFTPKNEKIVVRNNLLGLCDTAGTTVTVELVIASYNDYKVTAANFRLRSDYSKQCNLNLFKIDKGVVKVATTDSVYKTLCTLSSDYYTKIAITYDFATENIKAYYAVEGEEYQLVIDNHRETPAALATARDAGYEGYESMVDWILKAQHKIEWYGGDGSKSGKLTEAQLSTLLADLDGDGVGETPLSTDGTVDGINEEAYAKWFEDNRSMLVKDAKMYVGGVK